VIQRDVTDPLAYVRFWLDDAAQRLDTPAARTWLDWFDAQRIEAVGLGLVTVRRGGRTDPVVRVEDLRQRVQPPLGAQVAAWFDRQDWLGTRDAAALLAERYVAAERVTLRQEATIGPDGWQVDRQVLAMPDGLRWTEPADPLVVALVGAADGVLPLNSHLALLAASYDTSEDDFAKQAAPVVAHLVERGLLQPMPR
jgi:hypothetical protein